MEFQILTRTTICLNLFWDGIKSLWRLSKCCGIYLRNPNRFNSNENYIWNLNFQSKDSLFNYRTRASINRSQLVTPPPSTYIEKFIFYAFFMPQLQGQNNDFWLLTADNAGAVTVIRSGEKVWKILFSNEAINKWIKWENWG